MRVETAFLFGSALGCIFGFAIGWIMALYVFAKE